MAELCGYVVLAGYDELLPLALWYDMGPVRWVGNAWEKPAKASEGAVKVGLSDTISCSVVLMGLMEYPALVLNLISDDRCEGQPSNAGQA